MCKYRQAYPNKYFFVIILLFVIHSVSFSTEYYVATNGNDSNPGTEVSPFATLSKARDVVRTDLVGNADQNITVWIRGGTYYLSETVVFEPDDSPSDGYNVTYQAYAGETPVFSSGRVISGWTELDVNDEPADLPAEASGHLWVTDIPSEWGLFKTLFDSQNELPRARGDGFKPVADGDKENLYYPAGVIKNWPNLEDIEIVIRPKHRWVMNILPLESVDDVNRIATVAIPGTYAFTQELTNNINEFVWVENIIEGLDKPGEWVLNTQTGKLYLWPANDSAPSSTIAAPAFKELIRVEGEESTHLPVRNLVFRGLTFTHGERDTWTLDEACVQHDWECYDKGNALMRFRGGENCRVEYCNFVNSGGGGLRLDLHCQNIAVFGNKFEFLGGTGIGLLGYGPGTTDLNKNNRVLCNEIHDVGQHYWHCPGIMIFQSGDNIVANNLIYNTPYTGLILTCAAPKHFRTSFKREITGTIRWAEVGAPGTYTSEQVEPFLHGRNNMIKYNEIHHTMEFMGDGNGIYIRFCPAGNSIVRNYVHHIIGAGTNCAIRPDGDQSHTKINENIIYKCVKSGLMCKDFNWFENNIIAEMLHAGDPENLYGVDFKGYITVKTSANGSESVTDASLQRNIFYSSGDFEDYYWDNENLFYKTDSDNNLYYHAPNPGLSAGYITTLQSQGIDSNSISVDPLFVDINNGDLNLLSISPAITQLGFVELDFDCMGLVWPWDIDCDNDTDISDIAELSSDWLRGDLCDGYKRNGDLNYDCNVNSFDFVMLANHYMKVQKQGKGPIAWWKFDQGSGNTAVDSSGNAYDATITGASWVSGHNGGSALDFNGPDHVSVPAYALNSIKATGEITIVFWQYGDPAIQPQDDILFRAADSDNNRVINIIVPYGNEKIIWDAGNLGPDYDRINKYATDPSKYEGRWNHWAFTKNVNTGWMKIYLNGTLWHSGESNFRPMTDITTVKIGSHQDGDRSNYDGIIDDFRIYNYELIAADVNDIYNE